MITSCPNKFCINNEAGLYFCSCKRCNSTKSASYLGICKKLQLYNEINQKNQKEYQTLYEDYQYLRREQDRYVE
ncbi:MAG: hypothetical protein PHF86_15165 [Candidatus Nanoarchaeia archaeon]|nr:hypothetical protein [Candidatus Nanoarchaeia archaeon]